VTEIPEHVLQDLKQHNQENLLRFWDQLESDQQKRLMEQVAAVDLSQISKLIKNDGKEIDWAELADLAESPVAIALNETHETVSREEAIERGEQMLRDGNVAMILVAGGQGTRLGFDKPKGMYPVGPISNRTLFQILIEKVMGIGEYYGKPIPLFIMTSPATHEDTVKYLDENKNFGLPNSHCQIFCQGSMPAVDSESGDILMSSKSELFSSPDGHGGMLAALVKNGCLERLNSLGIESIYYGQIDNPLQQVCDPYSIGFHKLLESEMTTQVVRKNAPLQKVGNFVSVDGRAQIIEYSDLPAKNAEQRTENGDLKFWAGSIAVHVFETKFLRRVADQADALPFHRAHKTVPFVDSEGQLINPESANAIKFERFIFDLLPLARNALAIEIDPEDGFAAVKNAESAETETAKTARDAMVNQFKRWLDGCGVHVEPEVDVEINPLFAIHEKHLATKIDEVNSIIEPTYFC